jgi:hypothetical protein
MGAPFNKFQRECWCVFASYVRSMHYSSSVKLKANEFVLQSIVSSIAENCTKIRARNCLFRHPLTGIKPIVFVEC